MCFFWKFIANLFFLLKLTFFGFFKFLGIILRNMFLFCHAKKNAIEKFDVENDDNIDDLIVCFPQTNKKSKHKIALNCCQMTLNTKFGLNKL